MSKKRPLAKILPLAKENVQSVADLTRFRIEMPLGRAPRPRARPANSWCNDTTSRLRGCGSLCRFILGRLGLRRFGLFCWLVFCRLGLSWFILCRFVFCRFGLLGCLGFCRFGLLRCLGLGWLLLCWFGLR